VAKKSIALTVIAALLTISTRWTSWPEDEYFETTEKECDWLVLHLASRERRVNLAVFCSIVATLVWAVGLKVTHAEHDAT
jgi:hypothetical protein